MKYAEELAKKGVKESHLPKTSKNRKLKAKTIKQKIETIKKVNRMLGAVPGVDQEVMEGIWFARRPPGMANRMLTRKKGEKEKKAASTTEEVWDSVANWHILLVWSQKK